MVVASIVRPLATTGNARRFVSVSKDVALGLLRNSYGDIQAGIDALEAISDIEDMPLEGLEAALKRARLTRDQIALVFRTLNGSESEPR